MDNYELNEHEINKLRSWGIKATHQTDMARNHLYLQLGGIGVNGKFYGRQKGADDLKVLVTPLIEGATGVVRAWYSDNELGHVEDALPVIGEMVGRYNQKRHGELELVLLKGQFWDIVIGVRHKGKHYLGAVLSESHSNPSGPQIQAQADLVTDTGRTKPKNRAKWYLKTLATGKLGRPTFDRTAAQGILTAMAKTKGWVEPLRTSIEPHVLRKEVIGPFANTTDGLTTRCLKLSVAAKGIDPLTTYSFATHGASEKALVILTQKLQSLGYTSDNTSGDVATLLAALADADEVCAQAAKIKQVGMLYVAQSIHGLPLVIINDPDANRVVVALLPPDTVFTEEFKEVVALSDLADGQGVEGRVATKKEVGELFYQCGLGRVGAYGGVVDVAPYVRMVDSGEAVCLLQTTREG